MIHGLSDRRRLPRLGKIRLGVKIKKTCDVCKGKKTVGKEVCPKCRGEGFITYPKEVDYFVCPPKVQEVFGEKPKELRIMFPVEDEEVFFSQFYRSYGFNYLKCKGNGVKAWTWDMEKGGLKEIECPCEKLEQRKCSQTGFLQVLLPDVAGAGVWQINTGSKNSIIDVNSGISYIKTICKRISMIPLILRRVPTDTQRIENGQVKGGKHWTLQLDLENVSLRQLQQSAQIPPERALLPPVDEEKPEDLYPNHGFMPEEEAEETKAEMKKEAKDTTQEKPAEKEKEKSKAQKPTPVFEQKVIHELHAQLEKLTIEYQSEGGKISDKEWDRLNNYLKTRADYEEQIEHFTIRIENLRMTKKRKEAEEKLKGKKPQKESPPLDWPEEGMK